jgi:predicted ester cyclase
MQEGMTEQTVRDFTDNESYIRGVMVFRSAFPDYVIFVEDMTAEGDFVIIHGIFRGTHRGEIFGIPATFRKIEYQMMVKYHIENQKIINAWPMFDQMALYEQLGAINRPI